MRWISARDLEFWASALNSETELPGLVSDLIRASVEDISDVRFPSGDKGRVRGFDGFLVCQTSAMFVPRGHSFWEFGTDKDYRTKALKDFNKRSEEVPPETQRKTTYVFVSPWTWDSSKKDRKLEDFVAELKGKNQWKDVVYVDGSKLQTWLEACPAVSAWHAKNTLEIVPDSGARSLDEFWNDFVGRYDPKLVESVLLAGREKNANKLIEKLMGGAGPIRINADSADEVIAFAIAAIRRTQPEVRLFLEARAIIVDSLAAGRTLLTNKQLVFFLIGETAGSPGQFSDIAPTLIPLGRQQKSGNSSALARPTGQELGVALQELGISETQAMAYARGCGRSLSALHRLIPNGTFKEPDWVLDSTIFPAILAGAWDGTNEEDRKLIQQLCGSIGYESVTDRLRELSREDDPPFELNGGVWTVRAPIVAFLRTAGRIPPRVYESFRKCFVEAYSTLNEADDKDTNYFGDSDKYSSPYSSWLREGMANTLLMISALGEQAEVDIDEDNGKRFVNNAVAQLPGLKGSSELLACIRDELPLLAEAAPRPFIQALELMLEGDAEALRVLLTEDEGLYAPKAYHTGLLWALETLAWLPETCSKAIFILARLAEIDPGGRLENRPLNSLAEIFLPWNPQTCASLEHRNSLLARLSKEMPEISWKLLLKLLPEKTTFASGTVRPQLRDPQKGEGEEVLQQEYFSATRQAVSLVIELAGTRPSRWAELIHDLTAFPEQDLELATERLRVMFSSQPEEQYFPVWTKLRDRIADHKRFSEADWTLNGDELQSLEKLVGDFEPQDSVSKHLWMFTSWDTLMDEDEGAMEERRVNAVKEVLASAGADGLVKLGIEATLLSQLLGAIEQAAVEPRVLESVLNKSLKELDQTNFSVGVLGLLYSSAGSEFAKIWLKRSLSSNAIDEDMAGRLLLSWPLNSRTWYYVKYLGEAVHKSYWRNLNGFRLRGDEPSFLRGLLNLLSVGRGVGFFEATSRKFDRVPSRLILRAMEAVKEEVTTSKTVDNMLSYYLNNAFSELDRREDITRDQIVEHEMTFFSLLIGEKRNLVLYDEMSESPKLFNEAIQIVFRSTSASKKKQITETQRSNSKLAYSVLSNFKNLPGSTDDSVDADWLADWVGKARKSGSNTGHEEVTDSYIGHLFAHSPLDSDGGWPHTVVRDEIERLASASLERGIYIERRNMRGVTMRGYYEGGDQERELAKKYNRWQSLAQAWPRTSNLLRNIADSWDQDAKYYDIEAEQKKLKS